MTDQDKKRFASAVLAMFKTFHREEDMAITKVLFAALQHLEIEAAEYCITQAILKESRFPIPKDLLKYQYDIPRKPVARVEYKGECNPKMAERSMKLIEKIMGGELTKDQIIETMGMMEKTYPGIGWRDEQIKLVQYYRGNESGYNP